MPGVSNDKITSGIVIILAVGIVGIAAGVSEGLGKVLVVVMAGFLLVWLLTAGGQNDLMKWTGLMTPSTSTEVPGGVTIV